MTEETETRRPAGLNFMAALGLELWTGEADGLTHGRAEVHPRMFTPGTDRIRVGALATLADVVGGTLPDGPVNPTVDLRVHLLAPAPTAGQLHLVGRTTRVGKRLIVGEALIDAGDGSPPFARSTYTFVNRRIPNSRPPGDGPTPFGDRQGSLDVISIDDLFHVEFSSGGVAELGSNSDTRNPVWGTIQGGAQAWFAEIAAEHALGDRARGTTRDVDIRYLDRMQVGPLRATPQVLPTEGPDAVVRVALTDAGNDDAIVSFVTIVCRLG